MATTQVSEAEKVYIMHGVREDLRVDGRGCEDYRHMEIETDVVSNTDGSAKVSLETWVPRRNPVMQREHTESPYTDWRRDPCGVNGDGNDGKVLVMFCVDTAEGNTGSLTHSGQTDVLVGIKAEIGRPRPMLPDEGYLEFFVDCSANATPEFEGRGGEELGVELSNTLYKVFNNPQSVDLRSLCICPGEHCWVLYIDVLLLQCDGNLFDAMSIAIKAALFNTRISKVHISEDEEGGREIELTDDPYDCMHLNVENVPCIVTLCKIGHRHVVDATLQEKACSVASLLISVTHKGTVTCVRKLGGGSLDPDSIFEMTETGKRVGKMLHGPLMELLQKEENLGRERIKVGFLA